MTDRERIEEALREIVRLESLYTLRHFTYFGGEKEFFSPKDTDELVKYAREIRESAREVLFTEKMDGYTESTYRTREVLSASINWLEEASLYLDQAGRGRYRERGQGGEVSSFLRESDGEEIGKLYSQSKDLLEKVYTFAAERGERYGPSKDIELFTDVATHHGLNPYLSGHFRSSEENFLSPEAREGLEKLRAELREVDREAAKMTADLFVKQVEGVYEKDPIKLQPRS